MSDDTQKVTMAEVEQALMKALLKAAEAKKVDESASYMELDAVDKYSQALQRILSVK